MSSNVAQFVDGKFVTPSAQNLSLGTAGEATKNSSTPDKTDFLQLLVAQMKYQDPLEPTDNTEWVSQYATFSELETMQSVSSSMDLMRASGLVGQTVILNSVDSTGKESTVSGNVDYVVYENGKAYLSVNDGLYSIDTLQTVADNGYLEAYDKATKFVERTGKLPEAINMRLEDEQELTSLLAEYALMNEYERGFIHNEVVEKLEACAEQLRILKATES